jgi:hypothetical protein
MTRRAVIVLASIVALVGIGAGIVLVSQSDDHGESATDTAGAVPDVFISDDLTSLTTSLEAAYAVERIENADLPSERPIVPLRRSRDLPHTLQPAEGLEVDLPGADEGLVYRYPSHDQAIAAAPSFLVGGSVDGVQGCGAFVWLSESHDFKSKVSKSLARTDPECGRLGFEVG